MSTLHSKFQLVFEDMRFLQGEFFEAARAKIDRDLPSNPDQTTDPLRERVTQQVEGFIQDMFDQQLRHAVVVNGIDMGTVDSLEKELNKLDENIEPFDKALNSELRELYAKVDRTTLEVSQLRKTIAKEASEELENAYINNKRLIDDTFGDVQRRHKSSSLSTTVTVEAEAALPTERRQLTDQEVERAQDLQERYERLKERVGALKDVIPRVYVDLDRLETTTAFFQNTE